jgi:hypothetical protein
MIFSFVEHLLFFLWFPLIHMLPTHLPEPTSLQEDCHIYATGNRMPTFTGAVSCPSLWVRKETEPADFSALIIHKAIFVLFSILISPSVPFILSPPTFSHKLYFLPLLILF